MNQQQIESSENLFTLFQQDQSFNHGLQILKPEFEVGQLYINEHNWICKVLINKIDYDAIVSKGIEYFIGEIKQNRMSVQLNEQSQFNSGIIQYIYKGQLPLYYYHYGWECTLQNILLTYQENGKFMNRESALWIAKSIGQIIDLQHSQNIFLLNISIASVVFRNDFDFSKIQFNQVGNKSAYYRFILLNFSDASEQELKKHTIENLEFRIKEKFNTANQQYIIEQGFKCQPDPTEQLQIFIYQLRIHVDKYKQDIDNIKFDQLKRHLTVKITNFDCAESSDLQNQRQQTINKIPLKERHPNININKLNFNPIQQDYFSLGIIMYWIFNHSLFYKYQFPKNIRQEFREQQIIRQGINQGESQLSQKDDFLDQILTRGSIPEDYIGLLSEDVNIQKKAFKNVLNIQYDFAKIEQLQYKKQNDLSEYYQQ